MEVDLQSLFGLHVTWCAQLYSLAETPQVATPSPIPPNLDSYTRAILVRKDRRHLFVTPCSYIISKKTTCPVSCALSLVPIFPRNTLEHRDGIFTLLRSPGIDSTSLYNQADRYDNPIPTRFLAPVDYSKIRVLHYASCVGEQSCIEFLNILWGLGTE